MQTKEFNMNKKQKLVLWVYIALLILILIFPICDVFPLGYEIDGTIYPDEFLFIRKALDIEYREIYVDENGVKQEGHYLAATINTSAIFLEILGVSLITIALLMILKKDKDI
jgi:hypothetical protein